MKGKLAKASQPQAVMRNAEKWIGEVSEDNAKEMAENPAKYLSNLREMLKGDWQDAVNEGQYLSALGFSLAKAITLTSDWSFEFVVFEEYNYDIDDGVWSIVSPNKGTIIFPIGAMYRDYYDNAGVSGLYAKAIYADEYPKFPDNSFTEWEINQ